MIIIIIVIIIIIISIIIIIIIIIIAITISIDSNTHNNHDNNNANHLCMHGRLMVLRVHTNIMGSRGYLVFRHAIMAQEDEATLACNTVFNYRGPASGVVLGAGRHVARPAKSAYKDNC